jgi:RNA:NAD 2'-phosphotransferase (TPT1/KptA family)
MTLELLLTIVKEDTKQRFQVASMLVDPIDRRASTVRGAGSASTVRGAGAASTVRGAGNEPGIFHAAIRAVSGHSYPFLEDRTLCVPLTQRDLPSLSALVHVTRPYHLTAIMRAGIKPGAQQPTGGRPHVICLHHAG